MATLISRSLRNNIIVGLLLVAPIMITVFILNWLFHFVTDSVFPFFPEQWLGVHGELTTRILALALVLIGLFLIGLLTRNLVGRKLYQFGDSTLARIPVVSKIYVSVRQMSEAFLNQSQTLFKGVAMLEYPRPGIYSLGFVTAEVPQNLIPSNKGNDFVAIFIPTSPVPTAGYLVFAPRTDLHLLPMSVGDAMKLVVSGGAVFPGSGTVNGQANFLDKLEAWMATKEEKTPPAQAPGQPDKPTT